MTRAANALAVNHLLEQIMRDDRGRLLAALVARVGDLQRAEDALQEALISAVVHWGRNGLPHSPVGWLLQVGWRKALDRVRKSATEQRGHADILIRADDVDEEGEDIPDHRLRLIFTCCHPALEQKTRVALTLRTVCGLTTGEIARVFLDTEPAMGQRLSRAKAKISGAGIPFQVPEAQDWDARLNSVLTVIYLIFTAGHNAGAHVGRDLCEEAVFLARLVNVLRPADPEIEGALALLLITHARSAARVDGDGCMVALTEQNRALWDMGLVSEGRALLDHAIQRGRAGPFQVKAAIASLHAEVVVTDWPQILALYTRLLEWEPTPVVLLNRAVALAETGKVELALAEVEKLADALTSYQPFHAVRADFLARLGRAQEARIAFDTAIAATNSEPDILFLTRRRDRVVVSQA